MYTSTWNLNGCTDYSIEPEKLNIEGNFQNEDDNNINASTYLSIEVFSELEACNVPQPKGEVYRKSFN